MVFKGEMMELYWVGYVLGVFMGLLVSLIIVRLCDE